MKTGKKPEAEIPRPNIQPLEQAYHMLPAKTKPIVAEYTRLFFPVGVAKICLKTLFLCLHLPCA